MWSEELSLRSALSTSAKHCKVLSDPPLDNSAAIAQEVQNGNYDLCGVKARDAYDYPAGDLYY